MDHLLSCSCSRGDGSKRKTEPPPPRPQQACYLSTESGSGLLTTCAKNATDHALGNCARGRKRAGRFDFFPANRERCRPRRQVTGCMFHRACRVSSLADTRSGATRCGSTSKLKALLEVNKAAGDDESVAKLRNGAANIFGRTVNKPGEGGKLNLPELPLTQSLQLPISVSVPLLTCKGVHSRSGLRVQVAR